MTQNLSEPGLVLLYLYLYTYMAASPPNLVLELQNFLLSLLYSSMTGRNLYN